MDYYKELTAQTQATYELAVSPTVLGRTQDLRGASLALHSHRQLVRDILTASDLAAVRAIPEDHSYNRDYWQNVESDLPWTNVLTFRGRAIFNMRDRGIQVPVEVFCNDEGIVYFHGYHRLAVALELGFGTIAVKVCIITTDLAELARRLFSIYQGDAQYTLYQPVDHPFFQLFPIQAANSCWAEKVRVCTEATAGWAGEVIEVGAHFGMLTRALRKAGLDIRATELLHGYSTLQPLFEATGHDPIPYEVIGIQKLAEREGPVRLVMLGLMHHLIGKADLWAMMESKVLPWMQKWVPELVVEMSLLPKYLGKEAAVVVESDEDVEAFWNRYGYTSRRLMEGSMKRVTYLVTRR